MATLKLFQMFDNVARQVTGPIAAANREEPIIRAFTDALSNPQSDPGKYPDDFSLIHMGEQNQDTGEITPCEVQTIYSGRAWLVAKGDSSTG